MRAAVATSTSMAKTATSRAKTATSRAKTATSRAKPATSRAKPAAIALAVALAVAVVLAVEGCGSSPPTRFFSLEPTRAGTPLQIGVQTPVKVTAVHIPSVLDRRTIVRGERNYRLTVSSQDRWGGDFGEMLRRVLTQDLQVRLPAGMVVAPDAPAPGNARGIVVDILSFEPRGTAVELDADWVLLQGSPAQPLLHRSLQLSEPFDGSAGSQAASMSRLVGRLADSIAQGLQAQR